MRIKTWLVALLGSAAIFAAAALRDPAPAPSSAARTASTATSTAAPSTSLPDFVSTSTPPEGVVAPDPSTPTAPQASRPQDNGFQATAHPGSRVDAATIRRLHGDRPLTTTHPSMAAAITIQERNSAWLMEQPGVVGHGIGLNGDGAVALIVYTKAEVPGLPKEIEGLPVAPFRSGPISARRRQEAAPAAKGGKPGGGGTPTPPPTGTTPTSRWERPVPIGVSTGHPKITAGTIGCRVKKGTQVFALSNNHVYANSNSATEGNLSLQPGPYDGGMANDSIGTLYAFEPIKFFGLTTPSNSIPNNTMDAAIALCNTGTLGNATPPEGYGLPRTATASASLNLGVLKFGRTTGSTAGAVVTVSVTIDVDYTERKPRYARFVGQIEISDGDFSAGGDSGSLIVTENRNPIGLLFAGGSDSTFAAPIDPVLVKFGVSIDGD